MRGALPSRRFLSWLCQIAPGCLIKPAAPSLQWSSFLSFNARADRPGNIKLGSFAPCSDLKRRASQLISWISNQKGNWLPSLTALFHQDLPGRLF